MKFNPVHPGLFITATDTEVGKTVTTCAIAHALQQSGVRVGVCKPIATGCRVEREELYSEDAEALAHFSDCRLPLHTINPVRYKSPLSPAAAARRTKRGVDEALIRESLVELDGSHDVLLVEGIGGWLVPLSESRTVADMAKWIGYPVIVVARPNLGTLNHTAMTCRLIRESGLTLAGLVINRYDPESADDSVTDNPYWLSTQNRVKILASFPEAKGVVPSQGVIPAAVLEAAATVDWIKIAGTRG